MNKIFKYIISAILACMVYGLVYAVLLVGGGYIDVGPPAWVEVLAALAGLATLTWSVFKII